MKKVVLFGATGSIGRSTLAVLQKYSEEFSLLGITARTSIKKLKEIAEKFKVPYLVVEKEKDAEDLKKSLSYRAEVWWGEKGLEKLASLEEADLCVIGISGIKGLIPSFFSLKTGKTVAIANKESLIVAGDILKNTLKKHKAKLIPVDSEHSALFQLLKKERKRYVKKIYLTASGGPFYKISREKFKEITPEQAIAHPTWKMGAKISVDSATLMNKGFEVIEAKVLFNFSVDRIEVLIHPQSIVHGLVEFIDGSFLAHMSVPDMKIAIAYALTYPERKDLPVKVLDLTEIHTLTFEKPDFEKFPCLRMAFEAGKTGGIYPLILEASDEVVVDAFLKRKISFDQIPYFIEKTLNEFKITSIKIESIFDILEIHKEVCKFVEELINRNRS